MKAARLTCYLCKHDIPEGKRVTRIYAWYKPARLLPHCDPCSVRQMVASVKWRTHACEHCSRPVKQDWSNNRKRVFCSDLCRQRAYIANRPKHAKLARKCGTCSKQFVLVRSDASYCSSKCRQAAYRLRCA